MNHLVVFSHPNPKSFNRAILDTYVTALREAGQETRVRDLYALAFQPTLTASDLIGASTAQLAADVRAEQEQVAWADVITFIYPLWWAGMPAIAKGWVDRVFTEGFAYTFGEGGLTRLLATKRAVTITTLGDSCENYRRLGFIDAMDKLMDGILFDFAGISPIEHKYFGSVVTSSDEERRQMLADVARLAKRVAAEAGAPSGR
jgi:NAD(P)H dehydrogenase (quinone)